MSVRHLTILGATGTIGVNTLDVVARHPDRFNVVALSGNHQLDKLAEQCRVHSPRYAVVLDAASAARLREILKAMGSATEVLWGIAALEQIAALPEVDMVMAAIVGAAGLRPALAAAKAGKRILLANKETLVMAGSLFMQAVAAGGAELIPIDSEHNAIFQSLPRHFCGDLAACGVRRILLTASGGPFRTTPLNELAHVTPAQACAHPNWVMGKKISVDSATMMNKGLEVIEAHWLFNATPSQIQVVIHPQSVIHSMVDYLDGSVIAQLGNPDMRTPIAYALGFPERIDAGVSALDLFGRGLTFEPPDYARFPCLKLAFDALASGGMLPAVLNAANESAVAAFLAGHASYLTIPAAIEYALSRAPGGEPGSMDDLVQADLQARADADSFLETQRARA
ncbi:1-deoxy-D-xylulose 5-phosphate reductoisomerase [Sulfuriferula multivorans]|uniref:1-deoxy-D-xylulose 5-phosphate reductoisomerase n=1 Tax=Sulfuriferula multivorans TaxID=1559896 RepID=A0A401JG22_9PROT|nr:1-deoxy-D-xylulose-5-phosphate reductoisomerase [Sulfuriferula multivorans]GBL46585.1 1-deoxy-D-xylulose 5-phosphate reductoisomerase [Sulfuriferula multivorans]